MDHTDDLWSGYDPSPVEGAVSDPAFDPAQTDAFLVGLDADGIADAEATTDAKGGYELMPLEPGTPNTLDDPGAPTLDPSLDLTAPADPSMPGPAVIDGDPMDAWRTFQYQQY